jgi:hypothetical protein
MVRDRPLVMEYRGTCGNDHWTCGNDHWTCGNGNGQAAVGMGINGQAAVGMGMSSVGSQAR